MAALTGLGHRLGLDQQEAVRAVQLGVLTLNHPTDRNWSRSVLILVFLLVCGDPIPKDLVQVRLDLVRIRFVFLVTGTGRSRPVLVVIV